MTQYRVEWKSLITGYESHGDWHDSKQFIEEWVEHGNKEWSNKINHWLGVK